MVLHGGQPVLGLVISEAQFQDGFADNLDEAGAINNTVIEELVRLLSEMTHTGHKAPWSECFKYLIGIGALPRIEPDKQRKRLSKILAANTELFESRGSYITLHKKKVEQSPLIPQPAPGSDFVVISQYHVNQMIKHLLLSGLVTGGRPVKLVDVVNDGVAR